MADEGKPFDTIPSVHLSWLDNLTKPFSSLLNPIAERLGKWFGRRKPHLYVHFNPSQTVWCITKHSERDGSSTEMMHAMFWADFNHDDPKQTLIIMDGYPEGTHSQIVTVSDFVIPPGEIVDQQVIAIVLPIKGEKGKPWTGRFILVDQFQRKYKTKKVTFKWVG